MKKSLAVALLACWTALCGPVLAQDENEVAATVQEHLAGGRLGEADQQLSSMVAKTPDNADARLGLGFIRTARAFETLVRSLYRYGFSPRSEGYELVFGSRIGTIASNPNPEPITYDQFRGILSAFIADLDEADNVLAAVGDEPAKLKIDLSVIRFDWNGDGVLGSEDQLGSAVSDHDENGNPLPFVVGFDAADAKWLRGYGNLLRAAAKAWLSHDFSESWNSGFALAFPRAVSTMNTQAATRDDETIFGLQNGQASDIADFISLIHTIRWPIVDKVMWNEVRGHLKEVIELNRETWALIAKEDDDDNEWLPGPKQKNGVLPTLDVTEKRVETWLQVLSQFETVLDGKLLVPHWRFDKGVNVARIFDDPRPFDLVLWVTGPAAVPYLEDGSTMASGDWNQLTSIFGGNFMSYAFYFN
ncbi:hypothetical protein [Rhizobium sp. LCM 4573]|uniref:hypothetical protein n=1 Tax=Rhizobium sp. LCM 4573 TaxID=1848291 RepID=UPI0008D9C58A|nr:hypothetical protein [Rhizobium sp. LCM 4573]OHV76940.1 hypothetical protein LCM4573_09095 [Rhizobium sp. LCM 4573]